MTTLEMIKAAFASRGSVEAFEKMVRDDEREACAVICDRISADELCNCNEDESRIAGECADAIRSRK